MLVYLLFLSLKKTKKWSVFVILIKGFLVFFKKSENRVWVYINQYF